MIPKKLESILEELLEKHSQSEIEDLLSNINKEKEAEDKVLTIIVNKGVHHLPERYFRGEIYYATEGMLNFSDKKSTEQEFINALTRISKKLKENNWTKIYLVPFGPNVLVAQIKLLVYKITHIETVDVFHIGSGIYVDIDINQRHLVVSS